MTPDPELVLETKAWFKKAAHDLRMAELALRDDPPLTDQAVYHAQQSAEKAMKGMLTWQEQIFRKTHNLVELGEAAAIVEFCSTGFQGLSRVDTFYLPGWLDGRGFSVRITVE